MRCIVEHVDEPKLHLHYWVTPALTPDRRLSISDVDFGRQAAKAVKNAGGNGRAQKAASAQAMTEFQDRYWREVGCKHGLARLGPRRLRLTRRQWKDHEAERKRIAQAWLTFRSEQEKLQSATNAHVATRTAKVHAAAASAVEATTKVANERVMETKTTASGLVRRWKSHAAALNSVIEDHEAVIAEQAERLLELEALLREHGLPPGPTM